MKKEIVFLLIVILLTGCKAKYDLQINFGGGVTESGIIYLDKSLLGKIGNDSDDNEFLKSIAKDYYFSNYRTKTKFSDNNYVGYKFYHNYYSISSISAQTPAIKTLFDGLSVSENEHYVILKTTGSNKIGDYVSKLNEASVSVEEVEVSISLPYKVLRNNATEVDSKTNTYKWRFNLTSQNGIILEYRDNEYFTDDFLSLARYVSIYIYITAFILLMIIIIIIYCKCKYNQKNRI